MRELIAQFDLLYPQYKFLPFSHSCCIDEINNRGTDKFQKLQIDHVQGYFLDSSFLKETTPFYQKAEAHQALRKVVMAFFLWKREIRFKFFCAN